MLQNKRINTHFFTKTLLFTSKVKSTQDNICMYLFVSDTQFMFVVPMKARSEFPLTLELFTKEIEVPTQINMNPLGGQFLS